eukprot:CAMPEP_0202487146 /NCGR_PEP_ID=MMETSP1361-20130828/5563_1 /ASSEMBLY_ACC=CAM_ASM_000849 /TAXON_ID=210615 /ORGANISM="Staurosira complex sp., Strain CCMP2646" /LENGTH=189 /DNA_ID=CAMNT_0049116469 /DNA_START=64 /DNA_END=633 /DNA_ORIENTATION=+
MTLSTLLPPKLVAPPSCNTSTKEQVNALECSVHTLPKPFLREFHHVFRNHYLIDGAEEQKELLAIPTNQRARQDLVAVGDHIEEEKDRLLNVFIVFASDLCEKIRAMGYWADFIDPCSGLPMMTLGCNKVYSEVDSMECLLNYKSYNAGFCKILTHPKWGSSVYPATIFCHAPSDLILKLINELPAAMD